MPSIVGVPDSIRFSVLMYTIQVSLLGLLHTVILASFYPHALLAECLDLNFWPFLIELVFLLG